MNKKIGREGARKREAAHLLSQQTTRLMKLWPDTEHADAEE